MKGSERRISHGQCGGGRPALAGTRPPSAGRRDGRAFTLVELLVVVAILALLVAIAMPSLGRARELGRRAVCSTNLRGLGTGWWTYWPTHDYRIPKLSYQGDGRGDSDSQYDFLIYFVTTRWVNAGVLILNECIPTPNMYICPTIDYNTPWPWFSDTGGGFSNLYPTPFPPIAGGPHSRMTYGTRRMKHYDDAFLADVPYSDPNHEKYLATMVRNCRANTLDPRPEGFAFMADCFCNRSVALLSHVPGVNVLFLDGSVRFYTDPDGGTLYDNGIGETWGASNNVVHDRIWVTLGGEGR